MYAPNKNNNNSHFAHHLKENNHKYYVNHNFKLHVKNRKNLETLEIFKLERDFFKIMPT